MKSNISKDLFRNINMSLPMSLGILCHPVLWTGDFTFILYIYIFFLIIIFQYISISIYLFILFLSNQNQNQVWKKDCKNEKLVNCLLIF